MLNEIKDNNRNYNIMFRAQSGYGKTKLAFNCLAYLDGVTGSKYNNTSYYIPTGGEIPGIDETKRFHCLDEAHTLETPEELYPYLDSGLYTFFILTNEGGDLREPLRNRCIQFIFEPYTQEDLANIVASKLTPYKLNRELQLRIAELSRGNPRNAVKLSERLDYVFRSLYVPTSINELSQILLTILNINEDGLNELDRLYIDYLNRSGGRASLTAIQGGTGLDRSTIIRDIEPGLLYTNKIRITSKGRELCQ